MSDSLLMAWKQVNFPNTEVKYCFIIAGKVEALAQQDMYVADTSNG